jgi:hypothetical protein
MERMMHANKRKNSRRELFLGLMITLLGSPIVGSAIFFATVGIILSILIVAQTGEEIFFSVIAAYGALLGVLYLLLWRIVRRARVLMERWQATRRENQRTAPLRQSLAAAEERLSESTHLRSSFREDYPAESIAARR